jgi:hypothetical protein
MRKISVLVVFVLLVGIMPTKKAWSSCLFGECGPADQLINQNQRMVNRWSYGDHGHSDYGYYRDRRRGGGQNDGWLGLGLGVVAGALVYGALSNNNNQPNQAPPQPPPTYYRENDSPDRENGWNERLRDQANNAGGLWFGSRPSCRERGLFTLKNESGEVIRIYKNDQRSKVLLPGRSGCGDPSAEYEAEKVVAVSDGYIARAETRRAKPEGRSGGVWVWQ